MNQENIRYPEGLSGGIYMKILKRPVSSLSLADFGLYPK